MSGEQCRCEYPGENLYDDQTSLPETLITVNNSKVFPGLDPACIDLWFLCPNVDFFGGTPWTHECPSDEQDGGRRKLQSNDSIKWRFLGARQEPDKQSFYKSERNIGNEFPADFHQLLNGGQKEFYTTLPADNEFCMNGGTRIRSGGLPLANCESKILSFAKAGDRRPLPGGTSVSNQWFPTLGVKIAARSNGGAHNMYPVIFDMENPASNGVESNKAAMLGRHHELGNVLVPLRVAGATGPEDDYGQLTFEFYEKTSVNYITLLNPDDLCKVSITQANGTVSTFPVESAGPGGVQTVDLGLANVIRLTVAFTTFAAVVSLDLCIVRNQE